MLDISAYNTKTVLITGAAGFIGSHLCDSLLAANARVIGFDNFCTGRRENITHLEANSNWKFYEQDVLQTDWSSLVQELKPDFVFHLASPASPPGYQRLAVETYLINSYGTHLLLTALKQFAPASAFIFTSTSEVYGDPLQHPQSESYWGNVNPNGIRSCYDEAKRLGETICGVHARDFTMNVRIARIFNTFGPRMDPKDGRIIPNFFMQALQNQPLTVYGDGSQTRSFCYVADLVQGLLQLGSNPQAKGETINLGTTTEKTVLEMAEIIKTLTKSSSAIEFKPLPKDDPTQRRPDLTKASKILDWQPTMNMEEGLQQTLAYFSSLK